MKGAVALGLLVFFHCLTAYAQTNTAKPFALSQYEDAVNALRSPKEPGGPRADEYFAARARAEALEKEGAWADALDAWETAYGAANTAIRLAEFGTQPTTIGFPPNQFTIQTPKGWEHRREARERAATAAHRAGDAETAIRWAEGSQPKIEEFEADARAAGRVELADTYRLTLLKNERAALAVDLSTQRRRTHQRLMLFAIYELALLLTAIAIAVRHRRPRPRFTYLNPGRHVRSVPTPAFDWRPTIAAAIGGVFGLVIVAWLLVATSDYVGDEAAVVSLIAAVIVTELVLWVFAIAITRTPRAAHRAPRALDDLEPVQTHGLFELRAWFDANARDVRADFGVGRLRRARLERTVPAVSDPVLRSALAGWLGEQLAASSSDIPAWLDEHLAANLHLHPVGAWEVVASRYIRALPAVRRHGLLNELPAGVSPVLGGEVRDPNHTGPAAQWLELAMICGRRWDIAGWRARFRDVEMNRMLASVVWGAFDGDALIRSFRCDGEGGLLSLGYDSLVLDDLAGLEVGVAHVTELSDADRVAWEQELADFETFALFDQFARPVPPTRWRDDPGGTLDVEVPLGARSLTRLLDTGWERCSVGLQRHMHPFGLTVEAHTDVAGLRCSRLSFFAGYHATFQAGVAIEPDRVSDVAVSEVLYQLHRAGED